MGLYGYLQTTERPAKRAAQNELFRFASAYLGDRELTVVDLPSLDLRRHKSIIRMQRNGLNVANYYGYETDVGVYRAIQGYRYQGRDPGAVRVLVRNKEILADVSTTRGRKSKFGGRTVDLFHFDFCSALSPAHSVFQMVSGVSLHMAERAAVIVTFSPRGSGQVLPQDSVKHAFESTLPALFKVKVLGKLRRSYSDSTAMNSWCYVLEREQPRYINVNDDAVAPKTGRRGRKPLPITKRQVASALTVCHGNKTQAAKQLGISRATLQNRVRQFQLG